MSNNFSLYIRDNKLDEAEKIKKRQKLVSSFHKKNSKKTSDFDDLFQINFSVDRAGNNNCENMIGSVEIPVGLAGPVNVKNFVSVVANKNFTNRNSGVVDSKTKLKSVSDIFIPLATTEGALVASINRGCKAINLSKNLSVVIKKIGMTRALAFECSSTIGAYKFLDWIKNHHDELVDYCESTSNHLKFLSHHSFIRGKHVYLRFSFDTDEAMGMNMVTIALKYMWSKIKKHQLNS